MKTESAWTGSNYLSKRISFLLLVFTCAGVSAQDSLSVRHQNIVVISAFTAKGDLPALRVALHEGLDGGLTVNETKEVLMHLYAYCGFPRSLQAINTLIDVINERKAKGIIDKAGKTASQVSDKLTRYQRGKKVLESLTGKPEKGPKTGYAAFVPEIEVFLKEHLFADLFTRDVITYTDREIATISALIAMGGVEPMMQSHMRIGMNLGLNVPKLTYLVSIIENRVDAVEARAASKVLANLTGSANENAVDSTGLLARGVRAPAERFVGVVWVNMLVSPTDSLGHTAGLVRFEPGARTNWHLHPDGQVLMVMSGRGYYQEKGTPVKVIHKGDVVKCTPGVEHWHGASPEMEMSHIATSPVSEKGPVVWLQKVTDEQYNSNK